jgi:hypothetical protein
MLTYILKMNKLTSFTLFSAVVPFCDIPCNRLLTHSPNMILLVQKDYVVLINLEMQLRWPLRDNL